jgi:methyl-accepting chemotaxis protein
MLDLKIRTKLLIGYFVVVVVTLAVGATGIFSVYRIYDSSRHSYEESVLSMAHIASLYDNLSQQRICMSNIVLYQTIDRDFVSEERNSLSEKEETFETAYADLSPFIQQSKYRDVYKELGDLYHGHFSEVKSQLVHYVNGLDERTKTQLLREVDTIGSKMSAYIDDLLSAEREMARLSVQTNEDIYQSAFTIMGIVILLAALLAIVFAIRISNSISRPINGIVRISRSFGETGNL